MKAQRSETRAGFVDGATEEMKKKIVTDIKAAVMLIIAENLVALRTVVKTVMNSVYKSLGVREDAILRGKKKP